MSRPILFRRCPGLALPSPCSFRGNVHPRLWPSGGPSAGTATVYPGLQPPLAPLEVPRAPSMSFAANPLSSSLAAAQAIAARSMGLYLGGYAPGVPSGITPAWMAQQVRVVLTPVSCLCAGGSRPLRCRLAMRYPQWATPWGYAGGAGATAPAHFARSSAWESNAG